MKKQKNPLYIYRMKLTNYELRAYIAILNEHRLRLKAEKKDTSAVNDLLLRFIDAVPQ